MFCSSAALASRNSWIGSGLLEQQARDSRSANIKHAQHTGLYNPAGRAIECLRIGFIAHINQYM